MSQNSVILPTTGTVSGLQMTQATNNALDTLNTLASGASAPSSPEAGQLWHDTTNNIVKLRSLDNTSWIPLLNINESLYQASPAALAGASGFINRIINGAFLIDQQNEGSSYTIPVNNTLTYTADQWIAACLSSSASGVTVQRVSDAPAGFINSLKLTVGTGASSVGSTDYLALWQPIEANNVNDLGYGTVSAAYLSLSFWVKASIAGTYSVVLQNTGGARACVNKFTVTTPGSWQFVTIAGIPGDQSGTWGSGNAPCIYLYFVAAAGSTYQTGTLGAWLGGTYYASTAQTNTILTTSGATFQIAGIMLNAGAFPLPYEKRSIQQELAACQRYYEKTFPQGTAVAQNGGTPGAFSTIPAVSSFGMSACFSTAKRAAATIVTYNPSASNANWRDIGNGVDRTFIGGAPSDKSFQCYGASGAANSSTAIHFTASARM